MRDAKSTQGQINYHLREVRLGPHRVRLNIQKTQKIGIFKLFLKFLSFSSFPPMFDSI